MISKRLLAEWEPVEGVLIAMPDSHTDWDYMLDEAIEQYQRLLEALLQTGVKVLVLCRNRAECLRRFPMASDERVILIEEEYNDTWTRDYGPLCVDSHGELRLCDFGFNAWGLKFAAAKDNLVNMRLANRSILNPGAYRNHRDFVLEGGSVESDGQGTILTTSQCLTSPNRNGGKSKSELNEILNRRLGADHILWLDYGALDGDDTDSHIDTLARLAPNDTIIFTGCRDFDDTQFEKLLKMRAQLEMLRTPAGERYNLIELPLPDALYDPTDGSRLPATYANYLIVNNYILIPTYSSPEKDFLAREMLKVAFPTHEIIGVDCRSLLRQHGSLHCATMQLHKGAVSI